MITAIKIIFLLGFLILIHETGHFVVAKKLGIIVNEFAIGFGPKIFSKTKVIGLLFIFFTSSPAVDIAFKLYPFS